MRAPAAGSWIAIGPIRMAKKLHAWRGDTSFQGRCIGSPEFFFGAVPADEVTAAREAGHTGTRRPPLWPKNLFTTGHPQLAQGGARRVKRVRLSSPAGTRVPSRSTPFLARPETRPGEVKDLGVSQVQAAAAGVVVSCDVRREFFLGGHAPLPRLGWGEHAVLSCAY
jgi:hypothetical protein